MTPTKNLYEVKFRHIKYDGQGESVLNIIAVDFNEAMKKAAENVAQVQTQKDDTVELVGVNLVATIDVE